MGPSLLLLLQRMVSTSEAGKRQLGVRHFARPEGRARRQVGLKSSIIWFRGFLAYLQIFLTTKTVQSIV